MSVRSSLPLLFVFCVLHPGCAITSESVAPWTAELPARVRPGSPLVVEGPLGPGMDLRVEADTEAVHVILPAALTATALGVRANVNLPQDVMWPAGTVVRRVCIVDAPASLQPCVDVHAVWSPDVVPAPVTLAAKHIALGHELAIRGEDLLLPDEGQARLEVESVSVPGRRAVLPIRHAGALDWRNGVIDVLPDWTGIVPGPLTVRTRLLLNTRGAESQGPWSEASLVLDPALLVPIPNGQLRRGAPLPWQIDGVPADGWTLELSGQWSSADLPGAATALPHQAIAGALWRDRPVAAAASPWFLAEVQPALDVFGPQAELLVEAHLHLSNGADNWDGPSVTAKWRVAPTVQAIHVEMGAAYVDGLARLGLAA